jgi:large subunit ribosomal protein L10
MTREQKEQRVAYLTSEFKTAEAIVICDYKGMTVQDLESIRNKARESGTKLRVVKNSLSKIAMKNVGLEGVELKDTNIVVWGDDQVATCKIADTAANDFKDKFIMKSGFIEGRVSELSEIQAMAKLPSRDELIGMLLSVWTAPARNMVTGLDNLRTKLEEESA